MEGTLKFGTGPVRAAYFMLSSTQIQPDLDALTGQGFLASANYPNSTNSLIPEYGSVLNVRILTSSEAPVAIAASANGRNVFYNTFLGRQGVTHIEQDEYGMKLIYRDPLYSGMLAQNCTLAIKFSQAQLITQETAIRNLLSTSGYNITGL